MNEVPSNRNTGRKYRLVLFLVIALTAMSSAVREWNQLVEITEEVGQFISGFTNVVVPTANARTPRTVIIKQQSSEEFRWSGSLPAGKTIEVRGLNGGIDAQSSSGNLIEVIATKKARRGDPAAVQIKVVEHSGGVTICAQYPTEDGSYTQCETGESAKHQNRKVEIRKNDVSVHFEVRVPQGINLEARTVNGDINAKSLTGNVVCRTVNGGIEVSTTGYAEAATVNGRISATLGNANWTGSLSFSTVNGEIAVVMPAGLSADVSAKTLNGTINSDFPLEVQATKPWKNIRGTIGSGGRELLLKTLNGSINLRMS